MVKRRGFVLAFGCLASVGLAAATVALDKYLDPFDDLPFDHAGWAAAEAHERAPMTREAVRRLPMGSHAAEVRALLGEADMVSSNTICSGAQPREIKTWAYSLGSWSGFGPYGVDSAFLCVRLGSQGKAVAAEITGGVAGQLA